MDRSRSTSYTVRDDGAYRRLVASLFARKKNWADPHHERMHRLLDALDAPQEAYSIITVGGTVGKGTVSRTLAQLLIERGLRVGCLTSPHLHDFTERISVNGAPIDHDTLVACVQALAPLFAHLEAMAPRGRFSPCFTEAVLALALDHFRARDVDIAVIEAARGGAGDPSSVLPAALVILTEIALDHTHLFGDTVLDIAAEKAGLIARSSWVLSGVTGSTAIGVLQRRCEHMDATLFQLDEWVDHRRTAVTPEGQFFTYHGLDIAHERLCYPRFGSVLLQDTVLALAGYELLARRCTAAHGLLADPLAKRQIQRALARAPGLARMELLSNTPLVLVDAAHNPVALEALAKTLATDLRTVYGYDALTLILAVASHKPVEQMVAAIAPLAQRIVVTRAPYRGIDPERVAAAARSYCGSVTVRPVVHDAVDAALFLTRSTDLLCVTGSIFMIDNARNAFMQRFGPS